MDYVIMNPSKKLYIRLNKDGTPETCTKKDAQRFEYSKAMNISEHLPRTMKKFHFRVEGIPDVIAVESKEKEYDLPPKQVIVSTHYEVSDAVLKWVERVKDCNGLAKDAAKRKEELVKALSNADKDLSNCLHKIELEKWKNACGGYEEYKSSKIVLEKRRRIKDELAVVQSILSSNLESMATDRIDKVVKGLSERVFNVREVEDYDDL